MRLELRDRDATIAVCPIRPEVAVEGLEHVFHGLIQDRLLIQQKFGRPFFYLRPVVSFAKPRVCSLASGAEREARSGQDDLT